MKDKITVDRGWTILHPLQKGGKEIFHPFFIKNYPSNPAIDPHLSLINSFGTDLPPYVTIVERDAR